MVECPRMVISRDNGTRPGNPFAESINFSDPFVPLDCDWTLSDLENAPLLSFFDFPWIS